MNAVECNIEGNFFESVFVIENVQSMDSSTTDKKQSVNNAILNSNFQLILLIKIQFPYRLLHSYHDRRWASPRMLLLLSMLSSYVYSVC